MPQASAYTFSVAEHGLWAQTLVNLTKAGPCHVEASTRKQRARQQKSRNQSTPVETTGNQSKPLWLCEKRLHPPKGSPWAPIHQERIGDHAALLVAGRLSLKAVALTESPEDSAGQDGALPEDT